VDNLSASARWTVSVVAAVAVGFAAVSVTSAGAFGRTALWAVISDLCVPNFVKASNPFPCLSVEGDVERGGVAIVPDLWSRTQVLAVPTVRVRGTESSAVFSPDAPQWFEEAWNARHFVFRNLQHELPSEDIGLAINSRLSRTQDQLHIHIDCLKPEVQSALTLLQAQLSTEWSTKPITLHGHHYFARLLREQSLDGVNPFRLVADGPGRGEPNLERMSVALVASKLSDGQNGFILLAGRFSRGRNDGGHSEDILDHSCKIAGG
jgi:CDP-diacylglycerol pyrophosphatase